MKLGVHVKKIILLTLFFGLGFNLSIYAAEDLAPDSIKVSKKIITINQEALRAPASVQDTAQDETLSEAMEKVEEPKLWFNP